MTQLRAATRTPKSTPWKTGLVLVMASLGTACGGDGGSSAGGGGSTGDGGHGADGANAADSGNAADGGNAADSGNAADGGNATDSGNAADSANAPDTGGMSPLPVNLGTAGSYVILAKTAITTVPTSAITGDLGISPSGASSIAGFPLTADPSNVFSTSPQVTGKIYAADYSVPTPANLTTAVNDMLLAFSDAAGRAASVTELGSGNIGGMTLAPGVYKWGTGLLIPSNVTLSGSSTGVWIFQIAQDLTVSNAVIVTLAGGAVPKNVFWQVAGSTSIGTTAQFEGVILDQTMIAVATGASIHGRLLAQAQVTLESNAVIEPSP
jgi:hypothetical protein